MGEFLSAGLMVTRLDVATHWTLGVCIGGIAEDNPIEESWIPTISLAKGGIVDGREQPT